MAFIPTPRVARVAIRYDLFGQDVVNTLWFSKSSTNWALAELTTLANDIQFWVAGTLMPLLSTDMTLEDITATAQESNTAPSYVLVDGVTNGGEVGGASPSTNALVVKFNTLQRGRSGRGRNFIGGIAKSLIVGNTIDEGFVDDVLDAYTAMQESLTLGNHVVVSFQHDLVTLDEGFPQGVTSYQVVQRFVRQQRRRETGVGS